MVQIDVGNAKTAQEHFRLLQHAVAFGQVQINSDQAPMMTPIYHMLSDILRQLDEARPSGTDGKNGNLHTGNCGCVIDSDKSEHFTYIVINGYGRPVSSPSAPFSSFDEAREYALKRYRFHLEHNTGFHQLYVQERASLGTTVTTRISPSSVDTTQ